MATLDDISAEDFDTFKKDPTVSKNYFSLADDKKVKYEIDYKSKFTKEFRILKSQLMETAGIDSKSASQILLREIKKTHEQGGFLMQSSGNIDRDKFYLITRNIKRDVENGKYDSLIYRNKQNMENNTQKNENFQQFDLSTAEGKKEFLDNMYKDYSKCETQEEKINYIEKKFGISLKNMSEGQREQVVSKVDIRSEIWKIKDSLDDEKIKKQYPKLYKDEEKFDELKEKIAAKKYAQKNGKDVNELIKNNNLMREVDKITLAIEDLKLSSESDANEKIKILEEEREKKFYQLALSPKEQERTIDNVILTNKKNNNKEKFEKNKQDEENDVNSFYYNSENKDEENLYDTELDEGLFEIPGEEFDINLEENKSSNVEVKEENRILKFLKNVKNRLTQKKLPEGQFEKVQEEKNIITKNENNQKNKKSIFERIKNSLSKLVHRNKKDVLAIDTAENNTKVTGMKQEESWNLENYGTTRNEVNRKIDKAVKTSKQRQNGKIIEKNENIER